MTAIYVYAVIPTGKQLVFDVAGVDDDHDEVYTIPYRDFAAVVSASPLTDYRGLKREQAVRHLVAHQQVVEAVMREFPLLPLKFGTVLPGKVWVERLLQQGETLFRASLEQLSNLVQIEVVVLWNLDEVFREIAQEEPIAQLRAQASGRPGDETLRERVAIGQMVQASLEQRRAALQQRLLPPLREVAVDWMLNPLMDDSMVLNVALLLDKASQEALDRRLQALDEEFAGRFRFRRIGPLPPYSFGTIEVQAPSFDEINAARHRLVLGETATLDEIKRAYRQLAGSIHPDRNPGEPGAEARMAELTHAYRLLSAYAGVQGQRTDNSQSSGCRINRQAVEQTLLIAVRPQHVDA